MIAATGFEIQSAPSAGRMAGAETGLMGTCAVHLIDRRTGSAHRINGTPLVIFTRRPEAVSYTHLDGYKRQVRHGAAAPAARSLTHAGHRGTPLALCPMRCPAALCAGPDRVDL